MANLATLGGPAVWGCAEARHRLRVIRYQDEWEAGHAGQEFDWADHIDKGGRPSEEKPPTNLEVFNQSEVAKQLHMSDEWVRGAVIMRYAEELGRQFSGGCLGQEKLQPIRL